MTVQLGACFALVVLGLKELALIGLVALALYGRGGSRLLRATRYGRAIDPWLNLVRVPTPNQARARGAPNAPSPPEKAPPFWLGQGRLFWALAIVAAAAVAAWVATRMIVLGSAGVPH